MNALEESRKLFKSYETCMEKNPNDFIRCKPLRQALEEVAVKYRFGEIPVLERARQSYTKMRACTDTKKPEDWYKCQHFFPEVEEEKIHFFMLASTDDFFNSLDVPHPVDPKSRIMQALQHP